MQGLQSSLASIVAAHGFSCSMACGIIFPCPGIDITSLALPGRFLTTGQSGEHHWRWLCVHFFFLCLWKNTFFSLCNKNNIYIFPFIFCLFFNFTILYWFCHTLTWIRHGCASVPHPEPPLPPPSPSHPSGSSQGTSPEHRVSCIDPGLTICFTYDNLHVSVPFSQIIPPSPSPTESKKLFYTSVSLFLSRIQGYRYQLSKFHIYVLVYWIGVFLSDLLHSV